MAWYSNNAGEKNTPPNILLSEAPVSLIDNQYQLLMFVHPKCPCTRASIRELMRLMSHNSENISCTFFCFLPSDKNNSWLNTDITKSIEAIPNSTLISDIDGGWTKAFNTNTSGHVLLYHPNGKLLFSGGITAGRGHEGENFGRTFISNVVNKESNDNYQCPVFGCPIIR